MASRIPEEVVEYILSFMWKCNVCGIYIEMDTAKHVVPLEQKAIME